MSPISVWELLMLTRKGRVELEEDPVPWARRTLELLQLHEAPLMTEVALKTSAIGIPHSDPADRLIAASARVFDLTLVSADAKLIDASGIEILANR